MKNKKPDKLRCDMLYKNYEDTYRTLRLFGFDVRYGDVKNWDIIKNKSFTKKEIKKILGLSGLLGELRFRMFLRRHFEINWYKVFRIFEAENDRYIWDWYDSVGWV